MTVSPTSSTTDNTILQNYLNQQAQAQAAAASSSSSSSSSATGTNSLEGLSGNFNTFLNILTTQLKYQDPTAATDTNQFTQELVEFSGVEQQLNTNSKLDSIINLQKNQSGLTATLNYIGKYIEAPTTSTMPLQSGQAELAYTVPTGVSKVSINVTDSTGKTVATLTGSATAGLQRTAWDGKDSNGTQLADGTYNFQLSATDAGGNAVAISDIRTVGLVTAVSSNTDGTFNLQMTSGMSLPSSTVDAVYDASNLPVGVLGDPGSSSSTADTNS